MARTNSKKKKSTALKRRVAYYLSGKKSLIFSVLLILTIICFITLWQNNTLSEIKNKNYQLNQQIDNLKKDIDNRDADIREKQNEIDDLKQKLTFLPENLLALTNTKRIEAGVRPLKLNDKLNESARLKAEDMYAKVYWSHDAPDGTETWVFFDKVRYDNYTKIGENLAFGYYTGDAMVAGWMKSPSHKENLLSTEYTEVGFDTIYIDEVHSKFTKQLTVAHYGRRKV